MSEKFDNGYRAAQRAYDAQLPPDNDEEEDCKHQWYLKKEDQDGNRLYKCRECGAEDLD